MKLICSEKGSEFLKKEVELFLFDVAVSLYSYQWGLGLGYPSQGGSGHCLKVMKGHCYNNFFSYFMETSLY